VIVVDDHLALRMLTNGALMLDTNEVATTCSWWWQLSSRLSRPHGALHRRLERHHPLLRAALTAAVAALPDRLVVPERRDLLPAMTELAARYRVDLLSAEAVIAAEALGAELVLGRDVPAIRTVATERDLSYRVEP
jgi:hypothetical protein